MSAAASRTRAGTLLRARGLVLTGVTIVPTLVVGLVFAFQATVGISFLIIGVTLLAISAEKAAPHSIGVAKASKLSPRMIGLVVVSLGTDFSEIVNSIVSSAMGHVDINVGDSLVPYSRK